MRLLAIGYWLLAGSALIGAPALEAPRYGRGYVNGGAALEAPPNPRYDGRFTYARIKFTQSCCVQGGQYYDVKWGHDYPNSDFDFPKILQELSTMRVRTTGAVPWPATTSSASTAWPCCTSRRPKYD